MSEKQSCNTPILHHERSVLSSQLILGPVQYQNAPQKRPDNVPVTQQNRGPVMRSTQSTGNAPSGQQAPISRPQATPLALLFLLNESPRTRTQAMWIFHLLLGLRCSLTSIIDLIHADQILAPLPINSSPDIILAFMGQESFSRHQQTLFRNHPQVLFAQPGDDFRQIIRQVFHACAVPPPYKERIRLSHPPVL